MNALDKMRERIMEGTPEEQPEGLVVVLYNGCRGIRLVVDPTSGRAVASSNGNKNVQNHKDPAIAAMRAMSNILSGGVA